LLTICSEQKPLKSKDHGKNLLMASTAYQLLIFLYVYFKNVLYDFFKLFCYPRFACVENGPRNFVLRMGWAKDEQRWDNFACGKNGKKSFCGHSSMTVIPSNSRKNFLRTKKVETLDGYRRILISIQLRVYGTWQKKTKDQVVI
jgi:hypothetical protein